MCRSFGADGFGLPVMSGVPLGVDLHAFFDALVGELPEHRYVRALEAWALLSKGRPSLSLEELLAQFAAHLHPKVLRRELQASDVQADFEGAIAELLALDGSSAVTEEVWMRYIAELSCTTPRVKERIFSDVLSCFEMDKKVEVSLERLAQLTIFLVDKVRQFTRFEVDGMRKTLRQYFHLHDKNNSGGMDETSFGGFLKDIGMILSDFERKALFAHLAEACGGGRLAFDHLALTVNTVNSGLMPQETAYLAGVAPTQLVQKIKAHLQQHHPKKLRAAGGAFRTLDPQFRGYVSHADFFAALRLCGLRLGSQEVDRLLNFYDANKDGKVPYPQFLSDLRDGDTAAGKLGEVFAAVTGDVVREYDPRFHPEVERGHTTWEKKVEELAEFLGEEYQLGPVSKASFVEYFLGEAAGMDARQFERFLNEAFRSCARGG